MISINTNLASITAQKNFGLTTNKLNTAIERLSTGYKINHAGDNAAGYSILTNMDTQISSCDVAVNNISMGMDLLSVAQDTIEQMQSKANKLHALITQARNGTYGANSLSSIDMEAGAIIAEIHRMYNNAEYDGIGMIQKFKPEIPESMQTNGTLNGKTLEECAAEHNGFIREVDVDTPEIVVSVASELEDAINNYTVVGIANAETLAEFAKIVNGTEGYTKNSCSGKTICLTDDIDLSEYNWMPINNGIFGSTSFSGVFNGNGHVIENCNSTVYCNYKGLFGSLGRNVVIKNLGLTGTFSGFTDHGTGGIAGNASGGRIDNCWTDIEINVNKNIAGGIACSSTSGTIMNCYSKGNITSTQSCGGIVSSTNSSNISNCFSTGDISGGGEVGGIVGGLWPGNYSSCVNSYSTGNISSSGSCAGGVVGYAGNSESGNSTVLVSKCYSTGNVKGTGENTKVGGCVGYVKSRGRVENCYSTGNAEGKNYVGGFAGYVEYGGTINGGCSLGSATGTNYVGAAIGAAESVSASMSKEITINNITAYGDALGANDETTGSFVGRIVNTTDGTNYTAVNITNCQTLDKSHELVGGVYQLNTDDTTFNRINYDNSTFGISAVTAPATRISLQVGMYGNKDSQLSFDLGFNYDLEAIIKDGCTSDSAYNAVNEFVNTLGEKATALGALTNRLESALNTVEVTMDNLISSRSTLRDADIAKESSTFIRQQILQQAAATLMSTANQSPAIALQLI